MPLARLCNDLQHDIARLVPLHGSRKPLGTAPFQSRANRRRLARLASRRHLKTHPVCRRALLRLAARMNRARVSALATDSDAQTPQEITPVRAVSIDVRSQNLSCNLFLNRNQLRQERPIAHSSPSQVRRNGLQQCLFLHL